MGTAGGFAAERMMHGMPSTPHTNQHPEIASRSPGSASSPFLRSSPGPATCLPGDLLINYETHH